MSHLQQIVDTDQKYEQHNKVNFFFNARGSELQHSEEGMYRAIVYQIYRLSHSVRRSMNSKYRTKESAGHESVVWHMEELKHILTSYLCQESLDTPLLILIDALDEAGEPGGRQAASFWHAQMTNATPNAKPVKICMSSRHYPVIPMRRELCVNVEENNANDIRVFIRDELIVEYSMSSDEHALRQHAQELLTNNLTGALGNFQWISLIVPQLARLMDDGGLRTQRDIEEFIRQLPRDLELTYEWVIRNVIKPEYRPDSFRLFSMVCLSSEPPARADVEYLLAESSSGADAQFNPSKTSSDDLKGTSTKKLVASRSGGLLRVDALRRNRFPPDKNVYGGINPNAPSTPYEGVQTSHLTVFEYMQSNGLCLLRTLISPTTAGLGALSCISYAHYVLFKCCHKRLLEVCDFHESPPGSLGHPLFCKTDFSALVEQDYKHPFLYYSVSYLLRHGQGALHYHIDASALIAELSRQEIFVVAAVWKNYFNFHHDDIPIDASLLRLSVHLSLYDLMQAILDCASDARNAIEEDSEDVDNDYWDAQMISCDFPARKSYTLLHEAVTIGNIRSVEMLLQAGAALGERVYRDGTTYTPLMQAAARNHFSVVQKLVKCGADVNDMDDTSTVLILACQHEANNAKLVHFLLAKGAEVDVFFNDHRQIDEPQSINALYTACHAGSATIVQLLLEWGADVNIESQFGTTALAIAYSHDSANADPWYRVAQLLISSGAHVSAQDVHNACLHSNYRVLPELLQAVSSTEQEKLPPPFELLAGLLRKLKGICQPPEDLVIKAAKLLVKDSIAPQQSGGHAGMAMIYAARCNVPDVERYVKSLGARPSLEQINRKLLTFAKGRKTAAELKWLLDHGGNPNICLPDAPGNITLVEVLLCHGCQHLVGILHEAGARIPTREWLNVALSSLQYAAANRMDRRTYHLSKLTKEQDPLLAEWCEKWEDDAHSDDEALERPILEAELSHTMMSTPNVARCLVHFGARGCVKPGNAMRHSMQEGLTLLDIFADIEARAVQNLDLWEEPGNDEVLEMQQSDISMVDS